MQKLQAYRKSPHKSPLRDIKKFRFELTVLVLTLTKMVLRIVDTKDYFVE